MRNFFLVLAALLPLSLAAQQPVVLHSHNDYNRTAPFWEAYSQHCRSIEADVHWHDGQLLVGHDVEDLKPENTFLRMYVDPIVRTFRANGGKMWAGSPDRLMLMVELKSPTEPELSEVIKLLEQFPDVFCSPDGVQISIPATPRPRSISATIPPGWVMTETSATTTPRSSWSA